VGSALSPSTAGALCQPCPLKQQMRAVFPELHGHGPFKTASLFRFASPISKFDFCYFVWAIYTSLEHFVTRLTQSTLLWEHAVASYAWRPMIRCRWPTKARI
jgi:hypothetical protein